MPPVLSLFVSWSGPVSGGGLRPPPGTRFILSANGKPLLSANGKPLLTSK